MNMRPLVLLLLGCCLLSACDTADTPDTPDTPYVAAPATATADAQRADQCVNVSHVGTADLGAPVFIPPPPGEVVPIVGAGGVPATATLGPFTGLLSSVLTGEAQSGQGAVHYTLVHYFVEDGTGDAFWTQDRAVCAPAGRGPLVCRVNDVLAIVAGTGKFENAHGSLRNHGLITITDPTFTSNPFGTLGVNIRGRVCGDGL